MLFGAVDVRTRPSTATGVLRTKALTPPFPPCRVVVANAERGREIGVKGRGRELTGWLLVEAKLLYAWWVGVAGVMCWLSLG